MSEQELKDDNPECARKTGPPKAGRRLLPTRGESKETKG